MYETLNMDTFFLLIVFMSIFCCFRHCLQHQPGFPLSTAWLRDRPDGVGVGRSDCELCFCCQISYDSVPTGEIQDSRSFSRSVTDPICKVPFPMLSDIVTGSRYEDGDTRTRTLSRGHS